MPPPNASTGYMVQGVTLMPQDRTMACWYASAMMVMNARAGARGVARVTGSALVGAMYRANNGLDWPQARFFAEQVGLRPTPLVTPSPEQLDAWLRRWGALWTNGVLVAPDGSVPGGAHAVVIAGIRTAPAPTLYELLVYDPSPVNVGDVRWRPISQLVTILEAFRPRSPEGTMMSETEARIDETRDTAAGIARQTVTTQDVCFLYAP
jgi:hypothetical protein